MSEWIRRLFEQVPPAAQPLVIQAVASYDLWRVPMYAALVVVVLAGIRIYVEAHDA